MLFNVSVGCKAYIVGDMKTLAPQEYFQYVSLAKLFVELSRLHEFKPHIRKSVSVTKNMTLAGEDIEYSQSSVITSQHTPMFDLRQEGRYFK
jgi:hypothetical protein